MGEKIYGLVGRSLGHSLSVPIHRAMGCGEYRLYELEPEELKDFFGREDLGGVNVTIPYKRAVIPFCDVLSPSAEEIGSVNTVFRDSEGRLRGDNTDAFGLEYMAKRAGISFENRKVIVLGSGGASLTAVYVAKKGGAAQVTVISRSGEDNYENLSRNEDGEIIINATPVGMFPNTEASPVDLKLFPRCLGVLDLVYNPLRTTLLIQAADLGLPHSGGLSMLAAQAAEAERLFFGRKISEDEIEKILSDLYMQTQNIVLVGMPGSGKTTVGKALAKLSGRELVDTDSLITEQEKRDIVSIFAEKGEEYFRQLEKQAVARAGQMTGVIITTGGGTVLDAANRRPLLQNGRIYFITRDIMRLATEGRPLSKTADLKKMYKLRRPLYRHFASVTVKNNYSPKKTAEKIWREFCENSDY